jgi:hypothetical protein
MNFLALIGGGTILFVIYSLWSNFQSGSKKGAEMQELALSDYMKVKRTVKEWKSNPGSADAEGKAIAAAQFFWEIMKAHTFTSAASVKTKEDAFRFTYCKHFANLKSIDDSPIHGDSEFVFALHDIGEVERAAAP